MSCFFYLWLTADAARTGADKDRAEIIADAGKDKADADKDKAEIIADAGKDKADADKDKGLKSLPLLVGIMLGLARTGGRT